MGLRAALAISGLVHLLFFAPYFSDNKGDPPKRSEDKRCFVEIDYVRLDDYKITPPAPATAQKEEAPPSAVTDKPAAAIDEAKTVKTAATSEEKLIAKKKDYVSYYQIVRDRIRRELNENYRNPSEEGDVYLEFAIDKDGYLVDYRIDRSRSTPSAGLIKKAQTGLKRALPFPPPPEGLREGRISFNVMVSFKKNQ